MSTGRGGKSPVPAPEEQLLLSDRARNGVNITNSLTRTADRTRAQEPVKLTPAWEETNLPPDELNFKDVTMEAANLETNPPKDRLNLVYLILLLHGIGTLLPWNMFITAKTYFVDYKLDANYTHVQSPYAGQFMSYLGIASQAPNLIFNWLNIFIQIGGNLTTRIVWSIGVVMVCLIITVAMAMIDTSAVPGVFFWSTMVIVVVINMANGIYQNTVYGMAAKLPPNYTGAVVLGSNVSGTFTSIISIISQIVSPSVKMAAIYYFITALFVLSACFDTYFGLPLNRFYRYNELMSNKAIAKRAKETQNARTPFGKIFLQCAPQCFNVFLVFFVTLSMFPAVQVDIAMSDSNFVVTKDFYTPILCFLTFNTTAMIGSFLSSFGSFPGPRWLWLPVVLRIGFIPAFLLCNYVPEGGRIMPILITNDWAYWAISAGMGLTSGYWSSVGMMYCPRSVAPEHAAIASMFGAASLITGICGGIVASLIFPWIVQTISF